MRIRVSVRGTKELKRALRRFGNNAPKMLAKQLFTEANDIMAQSDALVPVDTGALRASARVEQPKIAGGRVSVQMGYGGPAAPYAFYVHENIGANFQRPGATAKYLEIPARNAIRGMAGRIAKRIRRDFPLNVGGKGARSRFMR